MPWLQQSGTVRGKRGRKVLDPECLPPQKLSPRLSKHKELVVPNRHTPKSPTRLRPLPIKQPIPPTITVSGHISQPSSDDQIPNSLIVETFWRSATTMDTPTECRTAGGHFEAHHYF
ncbi:hypothetical protein HOY80DRAFT_1040646 [Tuber brumale]|nr:hypothetical protein HOY80DRAFT_1040646 [Tuber brumale]